MKSEAKTSQKTPILAVTLAVSEQAQPAIELVRADLTEAAKVTGELALTPAADADDAPAVQVTAVELGEPPAKPAKRG